MGKLRQAKAPTHAELCSLAHAWLKRSASAGGPACQIAFREVKVQTRGEAADAIGFRLVSGECHSVLIECKTSRADFLADGKKPHRQAIAGMGTYRYYLAPEGLIKIGELPKRWGLIELDERYRLRVVAGRATEHCSATDDWKHEANIFHEWQLLGRLLSRVGDAERAHELQKELRRHLGNANRQVESMRIALAVATGKQLQLPQDAGAVVSSSPIALSRAVRASKCPPKLIDVARVSVGEESMAVEPHDIHHALVALCGDDLSEVHAVIKFYKMTRKEFVNLPDF